MSTTTHFGMTKAEVAPVGQEVAARRADPVAESASCHADVAVQRLGVGVDQQLVRVEAVAVLRVVGAVDAVAVELPGPHVGQIAVPDLVGVFGQRDAVGLAPALLVEEAQLDLGGIGGEQREIDAAAIPRRPAR